MERPLRVVLVHRYFAPDTPPYAHMLRSIGAALAARGHDVHVLTCQPSYRRDVVRSAARSEVVDGLSVRRFPVLDDRSSHLLKLVNLLWFCLRLAGSRRAFRGADVVMAATTPPVAVAALCSVLARSNGARFVYHKQDVWPEVSASRGIVARVLRRLDHRTEIRSAKVVVLSEDMAQTVRARGEGDVDLEVLNNFDPWTVKDVGSAAPVGDRVGLSIVFAGNLGRFQGVENLVEVVRLTADDERIEWHFFGDGPLRSLVERLGDRIHVHGQQPPEVVAEFVRDRADLGVVSLSPGVIRSAYPSKTLTYLRNGCPLLALVETDSELAGLVEDEQLGVTGPQAEPGAVADQLRALAAAPADLRRARDRCREVYKRRFAPDVQLARWVALVEDVAA